MEKHPRPWTAVLVPKPAAAGVGIQPTHARILDANGEVVIFETVDLDQREYVTGAIDRELAEIVASTANRPRD